MEKKFEKIKKIVERHCSCSAHSMDHILRVYNLCGRLGRGEKIDWQVLKAAALLHDIGRTKEDGDKSGQTDHAVVGAEMAGKILRKLGFSDKKIEHIKHCILTHRYRRSDRPETKEAKILFDADKLDSLGAIGVARSFAWAGRHNAYLYRIADINKYIRQNLGGKINGKIRDKTEHSPQIEYKTKLKFLLKRLYTSKARKIGRERMKYLREFLRKLEKEIKGEVVK
jgi:uncharacterized protein